MADAKKPEENMQAREMITTINKWVANVRQRKHVPKSEQILAANKRRGDGSTKKNT